MVQHEAPEGNGGPVPLVIVTHYAETGRFKAALARIKRLATVAAPRRLLQHGRLMRRADHPAAAWVLALTRAGAGRRGRSRSARRINDGSRLATAESLIERGTFADRRLGIRSSARRLVNAGCSRPIRSRSIRSRGTKISC